MVAVYTVVVTVMVLTKSILVIEEEIKDERSHDGTVEVVIEKGVVVATTVIRVEVDAGMVAVEVLICNHDEQKDIACESSFNKLIIPSTALQAFDASRVSKS